MEQLPADIDLSKFGFGDKGMSQDAQTRGHSRSHYKSQPQSQSQSQAQVNPFDFAQQFGSATPPEYLTRGLGQNQPQGLGIPQLQSQPQPQPQLQQMQGGGSNLNSINPRYKFVKDKNDFFF